MRFGVPLATSLVFVLSACSTQTVTTPEVAACKANIPLKKRITVKAVPTSCIVTAALYKSVGYEDPSILLCLAGGATSFLLGDSIETRRCSYRVFEDQLNGEIAHAQKMNKGFDVLFAQKAKEYKGYETQVKTVAQLQKVNEQETQQKKQVTKNLDAVIRKETEFTRTISEEVAFKTQTLKQSQQQKKTDYSEREKTLLKEIQLLHQQIKRLRAENEKLSKLQVQLASY